VILKVSSSGLSLIIADDHPLMRAGIKEVLSEDRLYHLSPRPVLSALNSFTAFGRMWL
jgi:DNA-binding NarL/FixJ family response regulator